VVKAVPGAGAARLIEEAAIRAQVPAFYLPGDIIASEPSALDRALERCPPQAWVIADPVPAAHAQTFAKAIEHIVSKRTVIVRLSDECTLPLRAPPEGITVGPLREYDARALVRAMLEGELDPKIDRILARRGAFLPGRIVEAVRAAVQLGTVIRNEHGWAFRTRRALKTSSHPRDPVAARIHDLPQSLREALRAVCALNDGRSTQTALALLRGLFSGAPDVALDRLSRLALVHRSDERIRIDESIRRAVGPIPPRALTLLACGAAAHGARAERYLAIDRPREAALAFAQAARAALDAGATAAALRYLVHASRDSDHPEIAATIRATLSAIGPAVTLEVLGTRTRPSRARSFDPSALEAAAADLESRNDADGASRLRALAELIRGNSQRAMQLTATSAAADESSAKRQLTVALAQASSGDAPSAARSALLALAIARQRNDSVGEAAALSLLSSLYRALGRDDDARAIADAAKKRWHATAPG
jgi:tetratricopeptide (TPR) repeat protein